MKVKPVVHYSGLGFPSRSVLDERPELLHLLPRRWQGNPTVIAALAGLGVLVSGARCLADEGQAKQAQSRVAPVFVHGDSQGTYGCASVNPPVFLSEADAEAVIQEEAQREGIQFRKHVWKLRSVRLPSQRSQDKDKVFDLRLDGSDDKLSISYEYVSENDALTWSGVENGIGGDYSTRVTANLLRDNVAERGPRGSYAVFYAPCAPCEVAGKRMNTTPVTREELRKQVQDFIKWLKVEGVI